MIDELNLYLFEKPYWDVYWPLFKDISQPSRHDGCAVLLGGWTHSFADEVGFVHWLRYRSQEDQARAHALLTKVEGWRKDLLPQAPPSHPQRYLRVLNAAADASGEQTCQHVYRCSQGGVEAVIEALAAAIMVNHGEISSVWRLQSAEANQVLVLSRSALAPIDQTGKITQLSSRLLKPLVVGKAWSA